MNLKKLNKKLLFFTLAAIFSYDSVQPMKSYLSKINPFSKSIDQKMNDFEKAQYKLRDARAQAEEKGKTSSRTVGRAVEELNKASRNLSSAVKKAQTRGELSDEHVERLGSFRSRLERKETRRADEGRNNPLTGAERETFNVLSEVVKPSQISPIIAQPAPTGFLSSQSGKVSVGLSDKRDPISAPLPGAPTSLQKRLDAVQEDKAVQSARKEFDAAKQESANFITRVETARQKAQLTQKPEDKAEFENLREQQQKLNKSMMQKQNLLLIEVESAEKSMKLAAEKPAEASKTWTKIIQTDTDRTPSGIKIGQKTVDTPPALPSRSSVFKKETSSNFSAEPEKASGQTVTKVNQEEKIISPKELAQSLKIAQKEEANLKKELDKSSKDLEQVRQRYSKLSNTLKKNMAQEEREQAQIYDNAHKDVAQKQARVQELTRQISLEPGNQANITQMQNAQRELKQSQINFNTALENAPTNYVKKMESVANKQSQTIIANAAAAGKWGDAGRNTFELKKELDALKLSSQTKAPQASEEKPSSTALLVRTPQEALEKAGVKRPVQEESEKGLSSGLSEFLKKPVVQEEKTSGPVPVTKDSPGGRTGVALPRQSKEEEEYYKLPKQEKIRLIQETFTVEK